MAADGEGGVEASSFRWIDVARYAVASVVTMLMVVVVVKAKMLLRPQALYLSVPGGSLFVRRLAWPEREVLLDFTIRAQNPSGRASLYYVEVTGYIFANNKTTHRDDIVARFYVQDMFLPQNAEQFRSMTVKLLDPFTSYFDVLYEGEGRNIITDVTLRLDGVLIRQPMSSFNMTSRGTTFYCRPLLIGGNRDVDAYINKQEAFCVSGGRGKSSGPPQ